MTWSETSPPLRFDRHAVRRMEIRGISAVEVAEALADRETTYHSELRPSRLVVLGRTGAGRRLKVVVEVADENYVWTVAGRDEED